MSFRDAFRDLEQVMERVKNWESAYREANYFDRLRSAMMELKVSAENVERQLDLEEESGQ